MQPVDRRSGRGPATVPVRDSKVPDGQVLLFGASSWASFLAELKG
ncbi:DUF397 domain-containing protein [Streptomyces lincolnensis]|nr:DUF397 domain-containing protein [Streptomyces lincolnensis]QMV12490.1 DUF397 domain-containing protein [Streptomyces lincolnensis]